MGSKSACAVSEYYAGFPVRNVEVNVVPTDEGNGVMFGRTVVVDRTPVIRVGLSRLASDSSLADDWVMTHEMVHLAFPRFQTSTTGSRKASPPTSSRSRAHRSATSHRR